MRQFNFGGLMVEETDVVPDDEIWVKSMDGSLEKSKIGEEGGQQKSLNSMIKSMEKDLSELIPILDQHQRNLVCNFIKKFFIRQDQKLNLRTIKRNEEMDDLRSKIQEYERKIQNYGVSKGRLWRKLKRANLR